MSYDSAALYFVGGENVTFYSQGNSGCSSHTDIYTYISAVDNNGDHYGFINVTTAGIGGPGCASPLPPANPVSGLGSTGNPSNPQSCCGDPISTGNGNYYYTHTDLSVLDHIAAIPLAFQRSYNSLDKYIGPLGNNWTHNFNVTLGLATTGATVVKWG